jgi:hypothetical protein
MTLRHRARARAMSRQKVSMIRSIRVPQVNLKECHYLWMKFGNVMETTVSRPLKELNREHGKSSIIMRQIRVKK